MIKKFLFISTLLLSASLSAIAQKVNVDLPQTTVKQAISELKTQGYSFVYQVGDLDTGKRISVNATSLQSAVEQILAGQNVTYKINGKNIVVTPAAPAPATTSVARPTNQVSGVVTDETGEPVVGATVRVKGTNRGTITDIDGKWNLAASPNESIEISFISYGTQTLKVGKNRTFQTTLVEDSEVLSEVVVVGYGQQKKVNLTGAVVSVDVAEQSKSRPFTDLSQALAGAAAGLNVMSTSSQPNSEGSSILIRGIGTLNNAAPLILVDGMEMSLSDINPNDVASISVLKDAASCAIYGNRGANGVILITTKNAEAGHISISYSGRLTYETTSKRHKQVTNYADYMELMNEACENTNQTPYFSQSTIDAWRAAAANPNGISESGYPNYVAYPNTDWYDEIYKPALMQEHTISLLGKERQTGYSMTGTYLNNPGLVTGSGMQKFYLRTSVETKVKDFLTLGIKAYGYHTDMDSNDISMLWGDDMKKTVAGVYPYYDGWYGSQETPEEEGTVHNPVHTLETALGWQKQEKITVNPYVQVDFLKDFTFQSQFFYNSYTQQNKYLTPGYSPSKSFQRDLESSIKPNEVTMQNNSNNDQRWLNKEWKFTNILRYNHKFGKHDVAVMGGYEEYRLWNEYLKAQKMGILNFELTDYDALTTAQSIGGFTTECASRSWFGRVNYAFDDRYLFEANVRRDGSSRFAPKSRWGTFPSFSAGWRITQEEFMSNVNWLNNLELRLSWGKLGNNSIGNYTWQSTYGVAYYTLGGEHITGFRMYNLPNTSLRWESTAVTNVGLDFAVLNSRLTGTLEYYNKQTDGILYAPHMQPILSDYYAPMQNFAEVNNAGFEITLGWNDRIGDISYGVTGNFSFNRNKITKLKGDLVREWRTDENGNPTYYTNFGDVADDSGLGVRVNGHMIDEYYLLKTYHGSGNGFAADGVNGGPKDGMIRTEQDLAWAKAMIDAGYKLLPGTSIGKQNIWYGDYIYADINGDGTYGDTYDRDFCGCSSTPKYYYGLQAYLKWKDLDFSMNWTGAAGFKIYYWSQSQNSTSMTKGYGIGLDLANDHYFYDPENPDDPRTNISSANPRLVMNDTGQNSANAEWKLQNGNYLKLKSITLGYSLPKKWAKAALMQNARLYVSIENVFTITKFKGLDPEMMSGDGYAPMRDFTFGLNVTF